MSDIKQYEPLWGSWYVESLLGEGAFGKVYKVKKEEFGKSYYSAVKILSIPQSEADLRTARSEGLDEASARSYFHSFVMDIIQEVDLMSAFRGNSNFVSLEDHKVIEKENEIGWDILIRMELLTSLSEHVTEHPLTPDDVVNLGIHICRALELCALRKTVHRDIKPDNIFVSQYGEYKLGDFGIARQIERTLSGLSKKGTETYMAPEVFRGAEYGASVDLYSLGIVMYRYLNRNRPPFYPAFPEPVLLRDREEALQRRMKGEDLPPLEGVGSALNAIVLKACAFDRKARFEDSTEMREALEALVESGGYVPIPLVSPSSRAKLPPSSAALKEHSPISPEPEKSDMEKLKIEKTEGIFTNRFTAGKNGGAGESDSEEPKVEVPAAVIKKLARLSGVFFGLLGALCWMGGLSISAFVFFPVYVLCAVQCALRFRSGYMNAFFLSALALYLAHSFLFAFEIFDYHVFIAMCSLLVLELVKFSKTAKSGNRRRGWLFCSAFIAAAVVAGALALRAIYGIRGGAYHAYVVGAAAIPLLTLFFALEIFFLTLAKDEKNASASGRAAGCLAALQFFPVIASVLWGVDYLRGVFSVEGINTLSYIAGANFFRISHNQFLWRPGWCVIGLAIQLLAFVPFFALASAQMTPDLFLRVFSKENKKELLLSFVFFMVVIAILTKVISAVPDFLP